MSNEKKIIKEMVQGNLKVNRKRNLLLVLAITLTTILFTSVLEIGFGGMQSIQETQLRLSGLKADAELRYLNKEQFQEVQNSELFESVGGRIPIAFLEGETKRPIEIDYLDKGGMEAYYLSLKEGKMPEDEKEVLLSEQALEELGIKKEVGSLVPMSFTLRGQAYSFDMRLAGWYTGNPKADFLIVSETFLKHNPEVTKNTYDDDKEVSGTYYATGCGKTYMACAFGMEACKQYYNTRYVRMPDLLMDLDIARTEGNYRKVMAKYSNPVLLILDEWMLLKPTDTEQKDIFELLHRRRKKSSTIFCSQYVFEEWYDQLGGEASPLADAIIDRIAHDSYQINITSIDAEHDKSMREVYGLDKTLRE